MEKFDSYAEAYHSAAWRLFEKSSPDEVHDINACPVVFLYRHALELYLKEILINGHRILRLGGGPFLTETDILENGHKLFKLWQEIEELHEKLGLTWQTDLDAEGAIIKEFSDVDQHSFGFRYPVKIDGDPTTQQNFRFSLRHFCCRMNQVLNRLEIMSGAMKEGLDAASEQAVDTMSDQISELSSEWG